jgi:hypothetical protein
MLLKDKDRILKAAREKWLIRYKRWSTKLRDKFLIINFGGQKLERWH